MPVLFRGFVKGCTGGVACYLTYLVLLLNMHGWEAGKGSCLCYWFPAVWRDRIAWQHEAAQRLAAVKRFSETKIEVQMGRLSLQTRGGEMEKIPLLINSRSRNHWCSRTENQLLKTLHSSKSNYKRQAISKHRYEQHVGNFIISWTEKASLQPLTLKSWLSANTPKHFLLQSILTITKGVYQTYPLVQLVQFKGSQTKRNFLPSS